MADKSIGELPVSSGLTDDALLAVYQDGQTQSINGGLIKKFARVGVELYVDGAKKSAEEADGSAAASKKSEDAAAASAQQSAKDVEVVKSAANEELARQEAEDKRVQAEKERVDENAGIVARATEKAGIAATAADAASLSAGTAKTEADRAKGIADGIDRGPPGPAGKSAYQQAVDGGYAGTEMEFKTILANAATTQYVDGKQLVFAGKTATVSAWVANSTHSAHGYGFRAAVACADVTASYIPDVSFSCADAVSGNFAPVADSYAGGVYIYCKTKPTATVTIPSIVCVKGA